MIDNELRADRRRARIGNASELVSETFERDDQNFSSWDEGQGLGLKASFRFGNTRMSLSASQK